MTNYTKTGNLADVLHQLNGQDKSVSDKEALKSIFDHALECVLPEHALRHYVKLDEKSNTLIVAGRDYNLNKFDIYLQGLYLLLLMSHCVVLQFRNIAWQESYLVLYYL